MNLMNWWVGGLYYFYVCACIEKKEKKFQFYTHIEQNRHKDLCLNGALVFVCGELGSGTDFG